MTFLDGGKLWLLLVVPLLLAAYIVLQRRRRTYAVRFTNLELLATIAPRRPGWRRHVAPGLMLLALVMLIGALARPAVDQAVPRQQASVILVIDVSLSMAADDIAPSRMVAAKQAATEFLKIVPPQLRIGVVSFSEFASLSSPLTRDRAATEAAIAGLRPLGGTAIGEGLYTALEEIQRVSASGRKTPASVLLLSDGQSNRGRPVDEASQQAHAAGVKVYTIGLGTQGATLDLGGREVPVDLDEAELRGIAEITDGAYFASGDAESLRAVYRNLGSSLGFEREKQEATATAAGIAAALLLLGALASLLWFQRIP